MDGSVYSHRGKKRKRGYHKVNKLHDIGETWTAILFDLQVVEAVEKAIDKEMSYKALLTEIEEDTQ